MGLWSILCESPADGFPNRLASDTVPVPPRRWLLPALLLLVCLLPRLWAAWHWNIFWTDTISYLQRTRALEAGEFEYTFRRLGLNTYPVILMWLRKTGLDVALTGEWWSVAMATLAVLPLFGWVRRQFDDQTATVACLLYAFHPKLVAFSPLIIRDATFWFLLNLSIYLMWRAVTENRWRLFLAAGAALTLTVHTRTEGWVLLVPLMLWPALRWRAVSGGRFRLVTGTLICLAVIPVSVSLVNLTWLRECPHWEMIRASEVRSVWRWLASFGEPAPEQVAEGDEDADADAQARRAASGRPSGIPLIRKMGIRLVKTYTYAWGLVALIGVAMWWRVYFRGEHQALLLMSLLLLTAIYIRYTRAEIDIRYFLPMVLVSFPWMALGTIWTAALLARFTGGLLVWTPNRRGALVAALLIAVALLGTFDMNATAAPRMHQQAALGKWIKRHFGARQRLGGNLKHMALTLHYAQAVQFRGLPGSTDAEHPEIVVVSPQGRSGKGWMDWASGQQREPRPEYRVLAEPDLPPDCEYILVLVHSRLSLRESSALPQSKRQ